MEGERGSTYIYIYIYMNYTWLSSRFSGENLGGQFPISHAGWKSRIRRSADSGQVSVGAGLHPGFRASVGCLTADFWLSAGGLELLEIAVVGVALG